MASDINISVEKSAPEDRHLNGPFDESEVTGIRPYVDLGSIRVEPREGLNLRLEVEEGTQRIVAVNLDQFGSTLQVQPFAATRSSGLWHEIRQQVMEHITSQGGIAEPVMGPVGLELKCQIPVVTSTGKPGIQDARFLGVDGPRWFVRGVITGPAATEASTGRAMIDLFRSLVIVRGETPMPPREMLPIRVPAQAGGAPSQALA